MSATEASIPKSLAEAARFLLLCSAVCCATLPAISVVRDGRPGMTQDLWKPWKLYNLTAKYNDKNNFGTNPHVALSEVRLAVPRCRHSSAYSASLSYPVFPSLPGGTDVREIAGMSSALLHTPLCPHAMSIGEVLVRTWDNLDNFSS